MIRLSFLGSLWRAAQLPLLGLVVLLAVYYVWSFLDLPPREALIELFKGYIAQYGYVIVFFGAFLESLLLVGWYVPGSLVILLSVILAPNAGAAATSVAIVIAGLWSGYTLNFFIGKYGWYKVLVAFGVEPYIKEAQGKLIRYGVLAIFSSYWSPGLASFTSTAAGVLHYHAPKFLAYSLAAATVWGSVWGVLFYTIGERALMLLSWPFVIFIIVLWIVVRYIDGRRAGKEALQ